MKERTLFVSDMDGTLLNSQSELSPSTIERLNTLINYKGVLFTVATARTPATATVLMKDGCRIMGSTAKLFLKRKDDEQ